MSTGTTVRSKLRHALFVLGLWLGFYVIGLALAGLLLSLPWAQLKYEDSLGPAGILCGLAALWVLIALIPLPGPRANRGTPLPAGAHPALEALIEKVAHGASQPVPKRVYLVAEATAFTAREPKWLGLASDPIVGIGLVLFELLSVPEIEAVIAHELGHHSGGDVYFGPWIRRTHLAITQALSRFEGSSFWLHLPFVIYGNFFVRVTRETSRAQELAADALAARLTSAETICSALRRIDELGMMWDIYFHQELVPMLEKLRRPPFWEGFEVFRQHARARPEIEKALAERLRRKAAEHDTHPSLTERLHALGASEASAAARSSVRPPEASAWHLLRSREEAEMHVLKELLVSGDPRTLRPIEWQAAGEEVWIPAWRERLKEYPELQGMTPSWLTIALAPGSDWPARTRRGVAVLSPAAERKRFADLASCWLGVHLFDRGFRPIAPPGANIELRKGELTVEPQRIVEDLASGALAPDEWLKKCELLDADGGAAA